MSGSEEQSRASQPEETLGDVAKRLGPASVLAILWAFLPAIGGFVLLANMAPVSAWLDSLGGLGWVIYSAIFTVTAGLGLLPTYAQATLGGYAFDPVLGTGAALAGFVGAASVGRIVASRFATERVEAEIQSKPKWSAVRDALLNSGALKRLGLVTLIRIPPNSPFALSNLVLTTTGVPWTTYLAATAFGMLPRTAAAVWIGSQVSDWDNIEKPKWLIIGGIVSAILVVLIVGQLAHNALVKFTAQAEAGDDSEG